MPEQPDTTAIRGYCIRLLARREHSRYELLTKCLAKRFPRNLIDVVLDELSQRDWQDDARYAEVFARQRIQKGYGPLAIRAELQQRGLALDDLDVLLATLVSNWQDVIERVYYAKYKQPPDNTQEKAKRFRFLQQRGFTPTQIQTLFKQHLHYSPTDY